MNDKRVYAVTQQQRERLAKAYGELMDVLCSEVESVVSNHRVTDYTDKDSVSFNKLLKSDCGQTALVAVRIDGLIDGAYVHDAAAERFQAEKTVERMEDQVRAAVERFRPNAH